jgi:hypothetical protein
MDYQKCKDIIDLISRCRLPRGVSPTLAQSERLAFEIAPELASHTEWLMSELKLRTESYNQCAAELQAANAKCDRLEREQYEVADKLDRCNAELEKASRELEILRADRVTTIETNKRIRNVLEPYGVNSRNGLAADVEIALARAKAGAERPRTPAQPDESLVERLAGLIDRMATSFYGDKKDVARAILSELASMPVELDSDELFDEMLKAYAIGIGGTANGAGIVAVREALRVRLAPLLVARKAVELPSHNELTEWFNYEYGGAEGEHIADQESSIGNGIRVLRDKLAERFGKKTRAVDDKKETHPVVKTEPTPNPERGLRQRFIEATKALGKDPYGRTATTDDLFTLIALIDKPRPCSSAEAVTRTMHALNGYGLRKNPETKSLTDGSWLTIARELSKHLDYEPTICAGFIQLRDGRIEFDHDKGVLVFSYFIP